MLSESSQPAAELQLLGGFRAKLLTCTMGRPFNGAVGPDDLTSCVVRLAVTPRQEYSAAAACRSPVAIARRIKLALFLSFFLFFVYHIWPKSILVDTQPVAIPIIILRRPCSLSRLQSSILLYVPANVSAVSIKKIFTKSEFY